MDNSKFNCQGKNNKIVKNRTLQLFSEVMYYRGGT